MREREIVRLTVSGMGMKESRKYEWNLMLPTVIAKVIHVYLLQYEKVYF